MGNINIVFYISPLLLGPFQKVMLEYMFIDRHCPHSSVFSVLKKRCCRAPLIVGCCSNYFYVHPIAKEEKKSKDQLAITGNKQLTFMQYSVHLQAKVCETIDAAKILFSLHVVPAGTAHISLFCQRNAFKQFHVARLC